MPAQVSEKSYVVSAFRRTVSGPAEAGDHGPAEAGRYVPTLLVTLLLSLYVVAAATSVRQKSITFDELGHLTGGVSSWLTSDYRLFPQNGQLPQRWATLLLVMSGVRFPPLDQPGWQ